MWNAVYQGSSLETQFSAILKGATAMTPHSSTLAWKILWMEESGRLLCPWDSPSKNPGMGGLALLQRIFPTQGWNPGLLHCRQALYQLRPQASRPALPLSTAVSELASVGESGL